MSSAIKVHHRNVPMFYRVPDLPVVALADVLWTLCPQQVTTQAAWRSAIEIAPGRLFAGRPHRRGFNRMPELADQTCTAKTYHSNATSAVVSTIRCVRRSEMDILQATQM